MAFGGLLSQLGIVVPLGSSTGKRSCRPQHDALWRILATTSRSYGWLLPASTKKGERMTLVDTWDRPAPGVVRGAHLQAGHYGFAGEDTH